MCCYYLLFPAYSIPKTKYLTFSYLQLKQRQLSFLNKAGILQTLLYIPTCCFSLTLPTAKAGGFLLQPLLHWIYHAVLQCLTQCPQARLYCSRMPYGAVLYLSMLPAFSVLCSKCLCLHWYLCFSLRI